MQLSVDASRSDDTRSTTRPPTIIEVEIRGFEYRPAVLRVVPGDTVRWTNHDIVPHTVTEAEVGTVDRWDSGQIAAGESYTKVIAAADLGSYYCRYHPTMTATLEAEEPTGMTR